MRLHRFFIDEPITDTQVVVTNADLIHQWKHVFRYLAGAQVILCDGSGYEFKAMINSFSNREVVCEVVSKRKGNVPERDLWLFLALIKKDRFEMAVEKATELGVTHVVPVKALRSTPMNINKERLENIVREASEQSGRSDIPIIHNSLSFADALKLAEEEHIATIMFDPSGEPLETFPVNLYERVALFIGPEGGWDKTEIEESDAKVFSLGTFILRAETAVVAVLAQFL